MNDRSLLSRRTFLFVLEATLAWLAVTLLVLPASAQASERVVLRVEGMVCSGCEGTVEHVLSNIDGVAVVTADRRTETATVTFDAQRTSKAELAQAINDNTYYVASVDRQRALSVTSRGGSVGPVGPLRPSTVGLGLAALVTVAAVAMLRPGARRSASAAPDAAIQRRPDDGAA
jgi:copper chaperone CopZ